MVWEITKGVWKDTVKGAKGSQPSFVKNSKVGNLSIDALHHCSAIDNRRVLLSMVQPSSSLNDTEVTPVFVLIHEFDHFFIN